MAVACYKLNTRPSTVKLAKKKPTLQKLKTAIFLRNSLGDATGSINLACQDARPVASSAILN